MTVTQRRCATISHFLLLKNKIHRRLGAQGQRRTQVNHHMDVNCRSRDEPERPVVVKCYTKHTGVCDRLQMANRWLGTHTPCLWPPERSEPSREKPPSSTVRSFWSRVDIYSWWGIESTLRNEVVSNWHLLVITREPSSNWNRPIFDHFHAKTKQRFHPLYLEWVLCRTTREPTVVKLELNYQNLFWGLRLPNNRLQNSIPMFLQSSAKHPMRKITLSSNWKVWKLTAGTSRSRRTPPREVRGAL